MPFKLWAIFFIFASRSGRSSSGRSIFFVRKTQVEIACIWNSEYYRYVLPKSYAGLVIQSFDAYYRNVVIRFCRTYRGAGLYVASIIVRVIL